MNFREREEFEHWLRLGHERGWLDREEVRTWLADKDLELNRDRMNRFDYTQNRMMGAGPMRGHMMHDDMYRRPQQIDRMYSGRIDQNELYDNQYRPQYGQNFSSQYSNRVSNREMGDLEMLGRYGEQSFNSPRDLKGLPNDYSHSGRGPKGFQRNDERIKDEAHELLTRHHEIDATDVEIEVKDGEVTLKGMVDNRYSKRLAEDLIDNIFGVKQVHNQIRVNKEGGFFLNNETKQNRELTPTRR